MGCKWHDPEYVETCWACVELRKCCDPCDPTSEEKSGGGLRSCKWHSPHHESNCWACEEENTTRDDADVETNKLHTECGHLQADLDELASLLEDVRRGWDAEILQCVQLRKENTVLRGLLEPCRADTDAQTDSSYPRTVNDVLSLLSAYIADFLPDDVCPGDEYFAAWERQARKVIHPIMEERERLRGLLRECSDYLGSCTQVDEVVSNWNKRVTAALEGKL
jgi:hypothetical protein